MRKERTEAQKEAARRNGAKSRGPNTERGKSISARNGTTHGLYSKATIIRGEDATRFKALLQSLRDQFQPATPLEDQLIDELAAVQWRHCRLQCMETAMYNAELDRQFTQPNLPKTNVERAVQALTALQSTPTLNYININQFRLGRELKRTLSRFLELKKYSIKAAVKKKDVKHEAVKNTALKNDDPNPIPV